ncbi:MAG: endonuclease/exonuclease/phosphatase [Thermodesulfobacteriota bacterium]
MARFTGAEWDKVLAFLDEHHARFGLPQQRADSVVMASFNIRKLGKVKKRSNQSWEFLKRFCQRCDLIAVQEVQDNLEGINYLKGLMGGNYGMVCSDITGGVPGATAMVERLAFIFHWPTIERTEVASDISYDRSAVIGKLFDNRVDFSKDFKKYALAITAWEKKVSAWKDGGKHGDKPEKPPFVLSNFVTFIRTPYCVSFRIPGFDGALPYELLAVNAHLLYGDASKQKQERRMEFDALIEWIISRAKQRDRLYHKNIILLGDMNLDFEEVDARRDEIRAKIMDLNKTIFKSLKAAKVNFPFLDVHKGQEEVFRSNARLNQTYDQIGLFSHDKRLPLDKENDTAGGTAGGFDFGVFNFVDLFSEALHGKPLMDISDNQQKALYEKFENDVSDHMPIWIRLPKPYAGQ